MIILRENDCPLPKGVDEIHLSIGPTNHIRFEEQVFAIDDILCILHVTLTGPDQVNWLSEELRHADQRNYWIDEDSFSDRQIISRRYGFA